uniref:Uncharacterized protein n=1 Tax=Vitis vinifera TaxID=29760 RepID=A5C519_VITVI|nr:hypothetical protein VITISV_032353 [Vitis vinifera]
MVNVFSYSECTITFQNVSIILSLSIDGVAVSGITCLDWREDVVIRDGGVRTRGGGVRTRGGGVHTRCGGVRTKGGGVRTRGGGVRTRCGGVRTRGYHISDDPHLLMMHR